MRGVVNRRRRIMAVWAVVLLIPLGLFIMAFATNTIGISGQLGQIGTIVLAYLVTVLGLYSWSEY